MKVALAQIDLLVGDVQGNTARIAGTARHAHSELGADLVVFPELALSGYPPEDLLFHRGFRRQIEAALERLRYEIGTASIIVGYPEYSGRDIYNSAALITGGVLAANHRKSELPNYKVFDEKRYFRPGAQPTVVDVKGFRVGLLVCEDIWGPEAAQMTRSAGAELLLVSNASPYEIHKQREREAVVRAHVQEVHLPVAYVNRVGGQDELVFTATTAFTAGSLETAVRTNSSSTATHSAWMRTACWWRARRPLSRALIWWNSRAMRTAARHRNPPPSPPSFPMRRACIARSSWACATMS